MFLNRLIALPAANSRLMRAYMTGILEVTGMMSSQGFPLRRFMKHLSTHMASKRRFPHPTLREADNDLVEPLAAKTFLRILSMQSTLGFRGILEPCVVHEFDVKRKLHPEEPRPLLEAPATCCARNSRLPR